MRVLLDTNAAIRLQNRDDARHALVLRCVHSLIEAGAVPMVCGQVIHEAWTVMTRPASADGWGFTPQMARVQTDAVLARYSLLPDPGDILFRWLDLVTAHGVRGRKSFDARLVALMLGAGVRHLVTLNPKDFRFPGIEVIVPGAIPTPPGPATPA